MAWPVRKVSGNSIAKVQILICLCRNPPKDRTLEIIEHSQVNKTIYGIFASCAALGILMATIFLIINIKYRNQRYIKMSSPQLNNLIIIGCMLTYTSVVFLGLDSGLSSVGKFINPKFQKKFNSSRIAMSVMA